MIVFFARSFQLSALSSQLSALSCLTADSC
jgi:hypothetical protein